MDKELNENLPEKREKQSSRSLKSTLDWLLKRLKAMPQEEQEKLAAELNRVQRFRAD